MSKPVNRPTCIYFIKRNGWRWEVWFCNRGFSADPANGATEWSTRLRFWRKITAMRVVQELQLAHWREVGGREVLPLGDRPSAVEERKPRMAALRYADGSLGDPVACDWNLEFCGEGRARFNVSGVSIFKVEARVRSMVALLDGEVVVEIDPKELGMDREPMRGGTLTLTA